MTLILSLILSLCTLLCDAAAFFPNPSGPNAQRRRRTSKLFYQNEGDITPSASTSKSKSALKHQERLHNSMTTAESAHYHRTDELWSQEWHDAFIRNGFVDFTPPMTDFLFCLMVGEGLGDSQQDTQSGANVLPWQKHKKENSPQHHLLEETIITAPPAADNSQTPINELESQEIDGGLDRFSTVLASQDSSSHNFRYDCILDTSLLNDLVHEAFQEVLSRAALKKVAKLLLEATQALQEHGIYVVMTKEPLPQTIQEFLKLAGTKIGMQWQFELEEISHGTVHVSVARKYFIGPMPSFGKLATLVEETS